jgi:hypothetical protein
LTIETIFAFCESHTGFWEYMPIERELPYLPRQWLINVAYTIIGAPFKKWVHQQIDIRNEKIRKVRHVEVKMSSEIA